MKNRLMRPSAALFPLALLGGYFFGMKSIAAEFIMFYFAMQLFSLCAVDAFRNAAAREPGRRRVDRRFWGSFPMIILSGGICAALAIYFDHNYSYELIAAAWLIIIEQLFEERLFTLNHRSDGSLLSLISNGLLFTGFMLDGANGLPMVFYLHGFYTMCAAVLCAAIAVLTSLFIAPPKGFSLIPRNITFSPKAMIQTLLLPAIIFYLYAGEIDWSADFPILQFRQDVTLMLLPGLLPWRLSRTVCRRSNDESRPLNLLLIAFCAAFAIAGCWVEQLMAVSALCFLTLICALIVYLRPSVRNILGTALMIAAYLSYAMLTEYKIYTVIACSILAVAINLKNAFLKKK